MCASSARTDLCGGCGATRIPTATQCPIGLRVLRDTVVTVPIGTKISISIVTLRGSNSKAQGEALRTDLQQGTRSEWTVQAMPPFRADFGCCAGPRLVSGARNASET